MTVLQSPIAQGRVHGVQLRFFRSPHAMPDGAWVDFEGLLRVLHLGEEGKREVRALIAHPDNAASILPVLTIHGPALIVSTRWVNQLFNELREAGFPAIGPGAIEEYNEVAQQAAEAVLAGMTDEQAAIYVDAILERDRAESLQCVN